MTDLEREEISVLPEKYRPLGAWSYFGYSILFVLPFVGFIFLIAFCFVDTNINRRSFARSFFCGLILVMIFALILLTNGLIQRIVNML